MPILRQKINPRTILRYALLQIPSLLVIILLLYLIDYWYAVNNTIAVVIILAWILKDILLFPFVWRSYLVEDKNKSKPMLGSKGIAVNDLSPIGQVRINGELWQAELYYPDETIFQGQCIEVKDIYGLKLKVSQYGLKDSNNNKRKE